MRARWQNLPLAPRLFQVSGPDLASSKAQTTFSELNIKALIGLTNHSVLCYHRISPGYIFETSISFSRMLWRPKVVMKAVVGLLQRKVGKITRRSIKIYWMAGILVVYHIAL